MRVASIAKRLLKQTVDAELWLAISLLDLSGI